MDSRAAIKASIDMGKMISMAYLGDLTDEEMMHRPHPQCNHIKWQIGHLIASENQMINGCVPGSMPDLPAGFAEKYTKETATVDDPGFFHSKEELMQAFEQQRNGTLAALDKLSDEDLGKSSPEAMQAYAPNWATAFVMQDSHWVMHAGQWAVIRRQLGRPPMF
ncbi:MAG: DinB family protein [Pirellulaceae bacterium]